MPGHFLMGLIQLVLKQLSKVFQGVQIGLAITLAILNTLIQVLWVMLAKA